MAFSALEALQAFGAGRQMALQDRTQQRAEQDYQRQQQERAGLAKAYDTTTGQIDPARARAAYVGAGDVAGALALDQHLEQIHGAQFTQYRNAIIAAPALLANVHDEPSYQAALQQAARVGLPVEAAPPHYDPQWVQGMIVTGTRLQAAQHYQAPPAVQLELQSAGVQPGTPEYRAAIMQHLSAPRIMMVEGVPTLVDATGSPSPAPTQEAVNPQTGERLRLNPQTQQWEPVAAGGPASAPGGFP